MRACECVCVLQGANNTAIAIYVAHLHCTLFHSIPLYCVCVVCCCRCCGWFFFGVHYYVAWNACIFMLISVAIQMLVWRHWSTGCYLVDNNLTGCCSKYTSFFSCPYILPTTGCERASEYVCVRAKTCKVKCLENSSAPYANVENGSDSSECKFNRNLDRSCKYVACKCVCLHICVTYYFADYQVALFQLLLWIFCMVWMSLSPSTSFLFLFSLYFFFSSA